MVVEVEEQEKNMSMDEGEAEDCRSSASEPKSFGMKPGLLSRELGFFQRSAGFLSGG